MCGICGIVRFTGPPIDVERVSRGNTLLQHRGPDDLGLWADDTQNPRVVLGATRLAVLDPTSSGHQPMHRAGNRFHLVFNGEIYNYRELREEFVRAGETFRTGCDTEVLLAACAMWGTEVFSHLNGMWAFGYYDSQTRSGFLARDRFGIKPLLYGDGNDSLVFASEMPAMLALANFDRTVDPFALLQHVQYGYIAHPRTIYSAVRRLPPGHYLSFGANGVGQPVRYYEPPISKDVFAPQEYGEVQTELRRRLAAATTIRRVSDVPIGAFLSGGLDSSIVVAHLTDAIGGPVRTFSVGFSGHCSYDETSYARIVAHHFGTDHHELILSERDVIDAIPRILDHLGEPFGDGSLLPTALLSQFARTGVTVALSGDGSDELFGGYWRYLGHAVRQSYRKIPRFLRKLIVEPALAGFAVSKSSALANRVRQFRKLLRTSSADPLTRHLSWSRILSPDAQRLFADSAQSSALDHSIHQIALDLTRSLNGDDPLRRILAFDLQFQLPADMLHKVDLASMMHSLEVRVPFLDPSVVELALRMPSSFKIDRGRRKRILVDAYRGHLPDAVLDRSKKGFEVPIGEFLRGPLRPMFHETVSKSTLESFGLLSYEAVQSIYSEHLSRRAEHADVLFALLSLCWWKRKFG